jgi:peptidoglycan hydrolase CwlO-like protein
MSDSIYELQDKLQHLESEVLDVSIRKTAGKDQLKTLQNEIGTTREKLDLVQMKNNYRSPNLQTQNGIIEKIG